MTDVEDGVPVVAAVSGLMDTVAVVEAEVAAAPAAAVAVAATAVEVAVGLQPELLVVVEFVGLAEQP